MKIDVSYSHIQKTEINCVSTLAKLERFDFCEHDVFMDIITSAEAKYK